MFINDLIQIQDAPDVQLMEMRKLLYFEKEYLRLVGGGVSFPFVFGADGGAGVQVLRVGPG
jgi:hypothetical protein